MSCEPSRYAVITVQMFDRLASGVLKNCLRIYKSSFGQTSRMTRSDAGSIDLRGNTSIGCFVGTALGMTRIHDIGPFRLDSEAGVLTKAGVPMALGPRGVAVLTALVERANEYVPKASLMDAAWPDVVVEESNLAVQISAIRRVLAQVPGGERWVETLARRGYRFVGPVTALPDFSRKTLRRKAGAPICPNR